MPLNIFKGKLDVNKVFDNAAKGIDALFLTDEERVNINKDIADAHIDYVTKTASENTQRSLTRRYIALLIVTVFLLLVLSVVILYPFNVEYAKFIYEVTKELLGTPFVAVIAFFFGGYYLSKFSEKRVKNKKTKTE